MSEAQWQALVIETARVLGWRCYHVHDSRRSAPGFPDLCLVRRDRLIFAELKSERGRVTAEQQEWLDALRGVGPAVEVYLWRPSDWLSITKILQGEEE